MAPSAFFGGNKRHQRRLGRQQQTTTRTQKKKKGGTGYGRRDREIQNGGDCLAIFNCKRIECSAKMPRKGRCLVFTIPSFLYTPGWLHHASFCVAGRPTSASPAQQRSRVDLSGTPQYFPRSSSSSSCGCLMKRPTCRHRVARDDAKKQDNVRTKDWGWRRWETQRFRRLPVYRNWAKRAAFFPRLR